MVIRGRCVVEAVLLLETADNERAAEIVQQVMTYAETLRLLPGEHISFDLRDVREATGREFLRLMTPPRRGRESEQPYGNRRRDESDG
jgi:hypothetical protein